MDYNLVLAILVGLIVILGVSATIIKSKKELFYLDSYTNTPDLQGIFPANLDDIAYGDKINYCLPFGQKGTYWPWEKSKYANGLGKHCDDHDNGGSHGHGGNDKKCGNINCCCRNKPVEFKSLQEIANPHYAGYPEGHGYRYDCQKDFKPQPFMQMTW